MREALLAGLFITRADVDPNADGDGLERRNMFGHDPQAIIEHDLTIQMVPGVWSWVPRRSEQAWSLCD